LTNYDFTYNKAISAKLKLLTELPNEIQKQAKDAYTHFKKDPYHPGLHFKRVHSTRPIYSARISINYRAVGIQKGSEIGVFTLFSLTSLAFYFLS
jgi:hypothetical protein